MGALIKEYERTVKEWKRAVSEREQVAEALADLANAAEHMLELDMHEQNGEHVEPDEWARAWEALADMRRAALAALPKEADDA